ncbi:SDR family NAD(P)-dependent oxidoreductase [Tabrizicola sp.]|uniref:SDR family NAD(P)-dependent oxidoreductase n=1 Tax=Tabrizicola sp. TaxID=2005166 RepID=UPI003D28B603
MRVLVIGASGGIGAAVMADYAQNGAEVLGLSRSRDGLDITDEASISEVLGRVSGEFDTVFVATGALELGGVAPEKSLRALTSAAMMQQFQLNAMGPALVLKHSARLLPRNRPARFAALSARVGSIGDNALGGWYSYRAAKAALNQLMHTGAIELTRSHPQSVVVTLHPGHVATPLSVKYGGTLPAVTAEAAAQNLRTVLEALSPAETGGFFDWAGKPIVW